MLSKYIDLREDQDYEKLIEPAKAIKAGKLVVLPTETVYGLGANALDKEAVNQIFKVKGRKSDNPLIVHISDIKMLDELVESVNTIEKMLINNFWPGPLTIVFKKKEIIPDVVTGNLDTVAVRMPSNEIARKLIEYASVPIAAPSANVSGKPSGTVLDDIKDELDGKVEYMIDSGATIIGVESTVVKVTDEVVHILRPGKVTKEEIESLGLKVEVESQVLRKYKEDEVVMSPGMKYRHYAPDTKCVLVYSNNEEKLVDKINELIKEENKKVLVLSKTRNLDKYNTENILDMGDTLESISKNIFTLLRKIDQYKVDLAIIEGVEPTNLGLAIMNRLIRACENNYIEV